MNDEKFRQVACNFAGKLEDAMRDEFQMAKAEFKEKYKECALIRNMDDESYVNLWSLGDAIMILQACDRVGMTPSEAAKATDIYIRASSTGILELTEKSVDIAKHIESSNSTNRR